MSKKCVEKSKFDCEKGSLSSPKRQASSSRRKHSQCHKESSRGCDLSLRSREKSKRTHKSRIKHSVELENIEKRSKSFREKKKSRRKIEGKRVKKEKRRNKKKKTCGKRKRKLSGSSTCRRLIELLVECCFCLKGFDSSSSTSSPAAASSRCCRCCECRFCRFDCDDKSIQCDDCVVMALSRHEIHKDADKLLHHSIKNEETDLTNHEIKENNVRLDVREGKTEARIRDKRNESESKIRRSIVKSLTALKDLKKRGDSSKLSSNENPIHFNDTTAKARKNCCIREEVSKFVSQPYKIFDTNEQNPKTCTIKRSCGNDVRSKSTKAFLIIFDIVFWPHTCFPK